MFPADPPPPAPPPIVRPFDPPDRPWQAGHRGADIRLPTDGRVRALAAGTVAFAGPVAGKPVVVVRLPDGRRVTYEPVRAVVAVGTRVGAGTVLGTVAERGGHCGADRGCLHVGLLRGTAYLDPRALWGPGPAVLKPW